MKKEKKQNLTLLKVISEFGVALNKKQFSSLRPILKDGFDDLKSHRKTITINDVEISISALRAFLEIFLEREGFNIENENNITCSFCNNSQLDVSNYVLLSKSYVCKTCFTLIYEKIKEENNSSGI